MKKTSHTAYSPTTEDINSLEKSLEGIFCHLLIFDNKFIYLSYNHMTLTQRERAEQEALRTEQEQHVA